MNTRIILLSTAVLAAAGAGAWWATRPPPGAQTAAAAATAATAATTINPATLSGTIRIAGSHNVAPLTREALTAFQAAAPGVQVQAITSNTSHGMRRLLSDQVEIANASRPVTDRELETVRTNGQELIELTMALSATAVVVSPANDFATTLTTDELSTLWESGGKVQRWSDLRPGWPDEKVILIARDKDSSLQQAFVQSILGKTRAARSDVRTAPEPDDAVAQVGASPYALTLLQLDELASRQEQVRTVAIDGGFGAVKPTAETIRDGTYTPLVRPMLIYVSAANAKRSEVDAFLGAYLQAAPTIAPKLGMIGLSETAYRVEAERLRRRIGGTIY